MKQEFPGQITHGMTYAPIYRQWAAMLERCMRPGHICYHRYGGRGIAVCDEWRDFEAFYRDMGDSWQCGLTLDRKNNDGNYEKSNCRWATYKEQALNNSRTHIIDTPWGRMPLGDAAERSGIHRTTIYSRIKAGKNPFQPRYYRGRMS